MFIPVLMLFLLGLGVPIFSLVLGFVADKPSGFAWLAIILVSVASIVGGVVIYVVARLQSKPTE